MSARREQLLDLAEQVLEEHGLELFGLGAIARAASIRTPSLYKHFSGIADVEHALMSRGFLRLAAVLDPAAHAAMVTAKRTDTKTETTNKTTNKTTTKTTTERTSGTQLIVAFAAAYRAHARAHPQLYRLMTERPLDRSLLVPGSEEAAMAALLHYFGETLDSHDRARAAWAGAHGLVALELAGRFPPGSDIDAAWAVYTSAFTR